MSFQQGGLGQMFSGIPGLLFPGQEGADPAQQGAAQKQAMVLMGLGMLASGSKGARLGEGLYTGLMGAQQGYQGAMQNAYQNSFMKRQEDRDEAREERAVTAETRAAAGETRDVETHTRDTRKEDIEEVARYLQMVPPSGVADWMQNGLTDPGLRAKFDRAGITPLIQSALATPDKADDAAALSQAQGMTAASAPAPALTSDQKNFAGAQQDPAFAQFLAQTGGSNIPSAVQEFEAYKSYSPEDKAAFLTVKRANQQAVIGGVPNLIPPSGVPEPLSNLPQEVAAAGALAEVKAESKAEGTSRAGLRETLPPEIMSLENEMDRNETILTKLKSGQIQTGPIAGLAPAITTEQQLFDVYSGEDVVSKISSATFGALSEGEREFLAKTALSRRKTEAANIAILERRQKIAEKALKIEKERLQNAGTAPTSGLHVGQVEDGYEFLGGDPANPESWRKK